MAEKEIVIRIRAENLTKAEFDKARKQLDDIGKKAGVTNSGVRTLGQGFEHATQRLARFNPIVGRASSVVGGFGPLAFAAAAGIGAYTAGLRNLVEDSERLTKEAGKLNLSVEEYQRQLGITIPLTNRAAKAGTELGKAWNDFSTSLKNSVSNVLASDTSLTKLLKTLTKIGSLMPGQSLFDVLNAPEPGPKIGTGGPQIPPAIRKQREKAEEDYQAALQRTLEWIEHTTSAYRIGEIAGKRYWENLKREVEEFQLALETIPSSMPTEIPGMNIGIGMGTPAIPINTGTWQPMAMSPGVDFSSFGKQTELAQVSLGDLNREMANFAHLADVLGPKWAAAFQGLSLGLSGIEGIQGGIGTLKSTTGILGTLSGIGGIIGGIGALVAPIVSFFKGLGGPDIGRDVGRDIGANISEELEKAIEESGKNAQLFLKEIFAEGDLGIDRLSEEVGDLFSMLSRGEISEKTLLGEMNELLPILIDNFDDLGTTGRAQIDRIIDAAKQAGVDLGEMGDQLDRMRRGIPELTLEGFASQFDLTPEQQARLQGLGLGIQTEEERVAETLDVPLELLKQLVPSLEEIGVSIAELPDFLEASGTDLAELGAKLELPPDLLTQLEALAPPDPLLAANATGDAIANRLGPTLADLRGIPDATARAVDRVGERLVLLLRDALAQGA